MGCFRGMTENSVEKRPEKASIIVRSFFHKFISGSEQRGKGKGITLLLLHGTGGNEKDLIPLGRELAPGASLLSPRGKILESGAPRFFKRLAEGVFDLEDLKFRTNELADFVAASSNEYGFDANTVVAVGYSNGANIAASMLLLRPEALQGAILFRAMVPLIPENLPNLSGKSIFLSAGTFDQIVPHDQVVKLHQLFKEAGARVTINWAESDHSLINVELEKARNFLRQHYS
jgi:phospholipase/carboxylesterase